jgi:hypothetical protein
MRFGRRFCQKNFQKRTNFVLFAKPLNVKHLQGKEAGLVISIMQYQQSAGKKLLPIAKLAGRYPCVTVTPGLPF